MTVLIGSNELKSPLLGATTLKQIRAGDKKVFPKGYTPTNTTFFYITWNWELTDRSQYSHTPETYWTINYTTLSNWQKVINFSWSSSVFYRFSEGIGKTQFTGHMRIRDKSTSISNMISFWRRDRNSSGPSTTDKWWALINTNYNKRTVSWWGSGDWQDTWSLWVSPQTSSFYLYSFSIDWRTCRIYKNWVLQGTYTWYVDIRGGSSTWWYFYLWSWRGYTYSEAPNWFANAYIWECILDWKIRTQTEIQEYYNLTKSLYWIS